MIAIIDYGMGNLLSVQKAVEKIGASAIITNDPSVIQKADQVILPGVGAIAPAMERLKEKGLISLIHSLITKKKPFLGICLGMQILFQYSHEGGEISALSVLLGSVYRFLGPKIPHMGWNQVEICNEHCSLFNGLSSGFNAYFCHSYYVAPKEMSTAAALTYYGVNFASAVCQQNIYGLQFHPEKSQEAGLQILKNFSQIR